MSGLYNSIFGTHPAAPAALFLLHTTTRALGRFRDAWIEQLPEVPGLEASYRIAVYTRNGGNNRTHYGDTISPGPECSCQACVMRFVVQKHPLYLADHDDAFDSTYAIIYFKVPGDALAQLRAEGAPPEMQLSDVSVPPIDTGERWRDVLAKMKDQ